MEKCLSNGSEWRSVSSMEVNGGNVSSMEVNGEVCHQWK